MAEPFLGQIMLCPYSFPPAGWMDCAGQVLPISQYSALFSLLGVQFGGNGTTNFALPDLQGRAAISFGQRPGGSDYTMGEASGVEAVTLSTAAIAAHAHGMNASAGNATMSTAKGNALARAEALRHGGFYHAAPADTTLSPKAIQAAGQNTAHNTMQPFLVLRYVIATRGVFPSRP